MWGLLLVGVVLLLCYIQYRRAISHLLIAEDMFPGPATVPLLGNALQLLWNRRGVPKYGEGLSWFYRRSFRLWVAHKLVVLINEPRYVEKLIGTTENLTKADQYNYLLDWIGRGLLTSDGSRWKKSRKILTPAFHFSILETFLEIFHRNGKVLIEKIAENTGKNINAYPLIKVYALDNICETAMGTKIDAQKNPDSDYVTSIKVMCEIIFTRILSPWLAPDFIFRWSSLGIRQEKSLSIIHSLTKKVIRQRREELKNSPVEEDEYDAGDGIRKKKVFLDILLQSSVEGGLTDDEIQEEVDTFMFEGHDTVTSAISFAIYCLANNPKCQEQAYEEIQEIFGDDDRVPTLEDLNNMRYLEQCIKETLRHYPSVPLFGRSLDEDLILDDHTTLPKGCQAVVMVPYLHLDAFVWEKPREFYPEHFELEAMARRHPYQYVPFSAGPRNCIGQRFAMYEMKSTISKILLNFKLLPANPQVPIELNVDLILVSETGTVVRFEKRRNN